MKNGLLLLPALLIGIYAPAWPKASSWSEGQSARQHLPGAQPAGQPGRRQPIGVVGGVWLRHALSSRVALQTELLYESRGAHFESDGQLGWEGSMGYFEHEERSRLQYLSLPVLARVQAGKFFGEVGPQLSYLLKARNELQTRDHVRNPGPYDYLLYTDTERTSAFQHWEAGYAVGLGMEVTPALSVGLRYYGALTSVYPSRVLDPSYVSRRAYANHYLLDKARNSSLQLQVSYRLSKS